MNLKNIVSVTNRKILAEKSESTDKAEISELLLDRIEELAQSSTEFILLREKDMSYSDYTLLAERAVAICDRHGKKLVLHTHIETAKSLSHPHIHLPYQTFKTLEPTFKDSLLTLGVSVHSTMEAINAERLGATYIIAGHIFETDCKKGLPPRGPEWLRKVASVCSIPVYAIGGIRNMTDVKAVLDAGAAGACMMSGVM